MQVTEFSPAEQAKLRDKLKPVIDKHGAAIAGHRGRAAGRTGQAAQVSAGRTALQHATSQGPGRADRRRHPALADAGDARGGGAAPRPAPALPADRSGPQRRRRSTTLPALIEAARTMGFAGLNITYPCKQAVIPLLDELSDEARAMGAVNTVVCRDGRADRPQHRRLGLELGLPPRAAAGRPAPRGAARRRRRRLGDRACGAAPGREAPGGQRPRGRTRRGAGRTA